MHKLRIDTRLDFLLSQALILEHIAELKSKAGIHNKIEWRNLINPINRGDVAKNTLCEHALEAHQMGKFLNEFNAFFSKKFNRDYDPSQTTLRLS